MATLGVVKSTSRLWLLRQHEFINENYKLSANSSAG
jgi:hypothetical protein